MRTRDILDENQRAVIERTEAEKRATQITDREALTLIRGYLANPFTPTEAIVSAVAAGASEDVISQIGDTSVNSAVASGVAYPPATARENQEPRYRFEPHSFDSSGPIYSAVKGTVRALDTVARSGSQLYNGVVRQFDRELNDEDGFGWGDVAQLANPAFYERTFREGIQNAAPMTELATAGRQLLETGRIDQGSGFGSGGSVREEQAAEQRRRLGTVIGPGGQPQAWTVGRANVDNLARMELIDRDSRWASIISGVIDATVSGATDVTNFIPARAGLNANGLRQIGGQTLRSASQYQAELKTALQVGDTVGAERALTKLGRTLKIDKNILRNQNLDDTQIAIRASLLNEAGVVTQNGFQQVLPMEFARFLGSGNGQRLVNRILNMGDEAEIARLHRGKVGTQTVVELAAAQTPEEVIAAYARALAYQGDGSSRAINYFPRLQVFNVGNGATVVRESMSSRTRAFNLKPGDAFIDIADPTSYQKIDQLYRTMPIGMKAATEGGGVVRNVVGETARAATRGYNRELRDVRVAEYIRAHASQDAAAMKDVISKIADDMQMMFVNAGFVPERAADLTRWSVDNTLAGKYSAADTLSGVKLNDNDTPLLFSQLLDNGVSIIDPEMFATAYRDLSRFRQVLRTNPVFSKYARLNDRVVEMRNRLEALEVGNGSPSEIVDLRREFTKLTNNMDNMEAAAFSRNAIDPFRAAALVRGTQMVLDNGMGALKNLLILRIAYIPRVVGEEVFRVLSGGHFDGSSGDWMAAVFRYRYKNDATGLAFSKPVKEYDRALNARAELLERAADMERLNTTRPGAFDQAAIDDLRAQAKAMGPEIGKLERAMGEATDAYYGALIGTRYDALDSITRQGVRNTLRNKTTGVANRTNANDMQNWVEGMADRVAFLAADPVTRQMARDGLNLDATVDWLMNGDGIEYLEKITKARIADGKAFNPGDITDVKAWVQDMYEEIKYVTGLDDELVAALATNTLGGQKLKLSKGSGRYSASTALKKKLRAFANDPNSPEQMWFTSRDFHTLGSKPSVMREIAAAFFGGAYGVSSDVLGRSPTFRRVYWRNMEDLLESASPKTAQKIVDRARKANVSRAQLSRLEARLPLATGTGGLAQLDGLAKAGALTYTRDLLFDASKRGAGMDMLRLMIPFGDAFKEVLTTWARLMARQRGLPVRKVSKKLIAGQEATGAGPGDIYGYDEETGQYTTMRDGRAEGMFYKDPATGEYRYRVPMSNLLTDVVGKLTGNDTSALGETAMGAEVRGLSMVGSILPGFGPVAGEIVDQVLPDSPAWRNFRSIIFPYGEPADPNTPGGGANVVERLIIPSWLRKSSALIPEDGIPGYFRNLLNDSRTDPMYQKTVNYAFKMVMAERLQNGDMGAANAANFEDVLAEARGLADAMYGMRGFFQNVGPATPAVEYMIETEIGSVQIGLLIDEMRDLERQYQAAGEDPDMAAFDIIDKYGPGAWTMTAPNNVAVIEGVSPSIAWDDWYLTGGKEIVDTFPEVGAYFGPDGTFDLSMSGVQQARGLTRPGTPQETYSMAAENLAWLQINRRIAQLGPESNWTQNDRRELSAMRDELRTRFGVDTTSQDSKEKREDKIVALERIYETALDGNEVAIKIMSTSTGKALAEYLDTRRVLSEFAQKNFDLVSLDGWLTSPRGAVLRTQLREVGNRLAREDSGFARIYNAILDREMTSAYLDAEAIGITRVGPTKVIEPREQEIAGLDQRRSRATQEIGGR